MGGCGVHTLAMKWGTDILARLRRQKGFTQETLAAAIGKSTSWVAKHEAKHDYAAEPNMHPSAEVKLADVLGLSLAQLRGEEPTPRTRATPEQIRADANKPEPDEGRRLPWVDFGEVDPGRNPHNRVNGIPISTNTDAGGGMDYQEEAITDEFLPFTLVPYRRWQPRAYIVKGDSMLRKFVEGDIVVVAPGLEDEIETDDYVVVQLANGDQTFKQVRIVDSETWELIPLNQDGHRPRLVKRSEIVAAAPVVGRWEPIFARRVKNWEK